MSTTSPWPLTANQQAYLQPFIAEAVADGVFVGFTAAGRLTAEPGATGPHGAPEEEIVHGTPLSDLCKEERWKHAEDPLDAWERLLDHAQTNKFPDAENTYRFKTHGLVYTAPIQDGFMLRLRIPACELTAAQGHGLADLAEKFGRGGVQITTRGNLQIREFKPGDIVTVLTRIQELGLTSRGAGGDNIRNVTASPDSGFAPDEVLDVRPQAKALHHYILNHRDLYGLPRKFNVAFDSGSSLSVAADTNDIGFFACRVTAATLARLEPGTISERPEPGVYFRIQLGGMTGHEDFASDCGLLIAPARAVAVAAAMIRVYAEHGDRTNRKKARLKYLLEKWGVEKFLEETQRELDFPLGRLPLAGGEPRGPAVKHAWLGARRQSQPGLSSLGIGVPVGRLTSGQMHGLADLATRYGRGELRLTVWQNVLIPHVAAADLADLQREVIALGLFHEASFATGGIVACTGNHGCKYAAADTKGHALALLRHLRGRVELGAPVNIHFTGCPNSCAQHYCGDIGFVGAKDQDGAEAYHVVLGGSMDQEQGIARDVLRIVPAGGVNALVEKILTTYEARKSPGETFAQWTRRHSAPELQEMFGG